MSFADAQVTVCTEPFQHVKFSRVFEDSQYEELRATFPVRLLSAYIHPDSRATGKATRFRYVVRFPHHIEPLPDPWRAAVSDLLSSRTRAMVEDILKVSTEGTETRFQVIRDTEDYFISPHPDKAKKVVTIHIYFPGELISGVGTRLHGEDGYEEEVPFAPNSGYGFARSEETIHSCPPVSSGVVRDSIILRYVKSKKAS